MIGDTEHDFERPGDAQAPLDSPPPLAPSGADEPREESLSGNADDEPSLQRRPFAAWGAARTEDRAPSLWRRTSERLKRLFRRSEPAPEASADESPDVNGAAEPSDVEAVEPVPSEFEPEPSAVDPEPAAVEAEAAGEDAGGDAGTVAEAKEDLTFLRTPAEPAEAIGATMASEEAYEEAEPERPGFFRRLFGRAGSRPEPEPEPAAVETAGEEVEVVETAEPEVEVPAPDSLRIEEPPEWPAFEDASAETPTADGETVAPVAGDGPLAGIPTLDEALPTDAAVESGAADAAPVEMASDLELPVEPPPPKRGFFARLFGRKPREPEPELEAELEPGQEPELEESSASVVDAADEAIASASDEFAPPPQAEPAFATVDDALPAEAPAVDASLGDTLSIEATPTEAIPVGELPTAPPPPESPVPATAADAGDYFGTPVYDFDTPQPDRATVEVEPPVDSRPTAEVEAHEEEADRDTDEFEAITIAEEAAVPPEEKTAEVKHEPGFFQKLFGRSKAVTQVEPAVAPPPAANPIFLVQKFRTFYNEVVVYKNQKAEVMAGFSTAIVTDYHADLSPDQAAQSLAVRLQQMLELQTAESSWMGGEIAELYPLAQYAMICLADEMLHTMEWPGQGAWGRNRLELTLQKTAAADIEFFSRVDKLLKNGQRTVGTKDLARVYLLTIASGFRGKYRPFDLIRPLAEYRRRLYEFVYDGDPLMLYADDRRIFPEAVSVTVVGKAVSRFTMAQRWAAILVLLLLGYTVISHLTWDRVSADLKDMTQRVQQARSATADPPTPNSDGGER